MLKYICIGIFFFLGIFPGYNQTTNLTTNLVDGKCYPTTSDSIKHYYDNFIANKGEFVYGHVYNNEHVTYKINPFLNDLFASGILFVNGKTFVDKAIAYDAMIDELVLRPFGYTNGRLLHLNKDIIDSVLLDYDNISYRLINLEIDPNRVLHSGFYEISRHNKLTMYTKYFAQIDMVEGVTNYRKGKKHYFEIDNTFYFIRNKKQLLELFPAHKKSIKKRLRPLNTRYKDLTQLQMIGVAQFIDSL